MGRISLKLSVQALLAMSISIDSINKLTEDLDFFDSSGSSDESMEDEYIEEALQVMEHIDQLRNFNLPRSILKTPVNLDMILNNFKHRSELFRQEARINFFTFDRLVERLQHQSVFQNDGYQQQIPVERQILIALKRFGTYGNNSSLQAIAHWAGIGKGTVHRVTRRVIVAVFESGMQKDHIRWSLEGSETREAAKQWVEDIGASSEWRDGWCMIDGTTISLFEKSHYYGDAFFDRKSRYSINVQIVNISHDRQIIDYVSGFNGSRHDSHCFLETSLYKHRSSLLTVDEWIWADVGYPLHDWLMIPYKKPHNRSVSNRDFNYNLSRIRIRSEHAIGYLKGRFQFLKELRIAIHTEQDIVYVAAWINACIILHAFAIDEEELSKDFEEDGYLFEHAYNEVDRILEESMEEETAQNSTRVRNQALAAGKAARLRLQSYLPERPATRPARR